jgi:hypothetical protein
MLLEEKEAIKKWCPFAISANPINMGSIFVAAGHNRDHPSGQIPACIGSACMAWRWAGEKPLRDIDLTTSDVVEETAIKPRLGYCGLARRPDYE